MKKATKERREFSVLACWWMMMMLTADTPYIISRGTERELADRCLGRRTLDNLMCCVMVARISWLFAMMSLSHANYKFFSS